MHNYIGRTLRLTDDGWFPTADLGFVTNGELAVLGRSDDVLVVGGRNINAGDVERVVDGHAAVRIGSCIAVPTDDGKYAVLMEPARADSLSGDLDDAATEIRADVVRYVGVAPRAHVRETRIAAEDTERQEATLARGRGNGPGRARGVGRALA